MQNGEGVWLRLVLISDTHLIHRNLEMPAGDILIHAGDFSNRGKEEEIREFDTWLGELDYKYKVVVPGNHDTGTDREALLRDREQRGKEGETLEQTALKNATVLCNRIMEVEGLKVFGFPYSLNPWSQHEHMRWWAHQVDGEAEMETMLEVFNDKSGDDGGVDIFVTHSPPHGVGDTGSKGMACGSQALRSLLQRKNPEQPSLWVFGHIHECGRQAYRIRGKKTVMVNASLAESEHLVVNGVHHPVGINQPIIIDMDRNTKNIIGMKGIIE